MTMSIIESPRGPVSVDPVDRDTVRIEFRYRNDRVKEKWRYDWRIWTDVRRDRFPPVSHDRYGAPLEGKYGSQHGGNPAHPRRISTGATGDRWRSVVTVFETEIIPLVREWMRTNDEALIDAEERRLREAHRLVVSEIEGLQRRLVGLTARRDTVFEQIVLVNAQRRSTVRDERKGPG
jgi:hypothetical protein